jgi:hypothetical protein
MTDALKEKFREFLEDTLKDEGGEYGVTDDSVGLIVRRFDDDITQALADERKEMKFWKAEADVQLRKDNDFIKMVQASERRRCVERFEKCRNTGETNQPDFYDDEIEYAIQSLK